MTLPPSPPVPSWPVVQQHSLPLPALAPVPPRRPARRKGRARLLVAAGLCLVLAILLGVTAITRYSTGQRPQAAVRGYFAALASGDAPAALGYALDPPQSKYLTSDVLKQQLHVAPIRQLTVGTVQTAGDTAEIDVSYRLEFAAGAVQVDDVAHLARRGRAWKLTTVSNPVTLPNTTTGLDRLTFAGQPLPTGPVTVFPGALPVVAVDKALALSGTPLTRLADNDPEPELSVAVSASAKQSLNAALNAAFAKCLAGTDANPLCPLPYLGRSIPGSLRGTPPASQQADVSLDSEGKGRIDLTAMELVQGEWQTWDFNNQAVKHSGQVNVRLHAYASVADANAIVWSADE